MLCGGFPQATTAWIHGAWHMIWAMHGTRIWKSDAEQIADTEISDQLPLAESA